MAGRCRLHVLGGSGSGTTTLGRAVASLWSVPHADADDYFWLPTDPAFVEKRPVAERLDLMQALFVPRDAWVLSGSMASWGAPLTPFLDAVVLLTVNADTRLQRLRSRESLRYGDEIGPGGAREQAHQAFIEWARGYDDPNFEGRSRAAHERWVASLACPVLRLDGGQSVEELTDCVAQWTARIA